MIFKTVNTYQRLGVPAQVINTIFVLIMALLIAPYVGGIDFGVVKVPDLPLGLETLLKWLAPFLLFVYLLLFIPFWEADTANVKSTGKEQPDAIHESLQNVNVKQSLNGRSPSEFVETIDKKLINSGHTVPSESIRRSLFSAATIPRVDPKNPRISVRSSEGHTIKGATVVAIAENDTTKSGTTNDDGIVELVIPTRRAYKLLIAHPEYPGAIIHAWDPGEDVNITLAVTENTGSVICMSTGYIPGLSGRLNPILDTSDRTYLYADNIAIDGGKNQPATFRVDEPFKLEDADGVVMQVRVLHIQGRTSLLQYVRARYDC